ncbi:hypothetical protein DSL72_002171 [Monilinia vaccinii-corymbosi]|uniref:Uncharacterized protein n=1 Tax=Monilinia vaccinii-corymbosi TaxID=61207 RepID=A0A8A3PBV0_9HELO|nr:hypothetical protein DSL72_002171 [Monilinia vaccinii-corymbosi]
MEETHLSNSTPQVIRANYKPSEVPFKLPLSTETSSEKGEFLVIPMSAAGPSDHDTRTQVPYPLRFGMPPVTVTHKGFGWLSDAGVRGSVATVCHGTFHSQPATLIVFTFVFRSGDHGFRFKNANVKINFSHRHSSASASRSGDIKPRGESGWNPSVVKLAPRKIYGLPTVEGRKQKIGGEISLQVPIGTLTVGPSAAFDRESSFDVTHRYSLIGNFWSSRRDSGWDVAYWDVKENKRTKQGIPDRLNVGVVVYREGMFSADVQVTVDTPVMDGIFGFPWSKERPVTFVPGVETGVDGVRTRKFEDLRDEDWKGLIPWDEEWGNLDTDHSGIDTAPPGYTKS